MIHGRDSAVLKNKDVTTPVNFVIGKACKPHPEGHQVAQRQQPKIFKN